MIDCHDTAWKVPKYGLISGPTYFPVFGLNTEIYDKSPCLDTFHPVWLFYNSQNCKQIKKFWSSSQRLTSSQYYKTSNFLLVHWVSWFKILKENITDLYFFRSIFAVGFLYYSFVVNVTINETIMLISTRFHLEFLRTSENMLTI